MHMHSAAARGSSWTNHHRWAQFVGKWAALPPECAVLSGDRLVSGTDGGRRSVCARVRACVCVCGRMSVFPSVLKSPCVSQPTGVKNSCRSLEESLHKVTYVPWAFQPGSVRTLSFPVSLFTPTLSPSPAHPPHPNPPWLNGSPRPQWQELSLCANEPPRVN